MSTFLNTIHILCDVLGVLTKPDRCQDAANEKWAKYIGGEIERLHHGWFCVKQYDTQSGHAQPTLSGARDEEVHYFDKSDVWRALSREARKRLGTVKLVQRLEDILSELISNRYAIFCICTEPMANNNPS